MVSTFIVPRCKNSKSKHVSLVLSLI